MKSISPFLLFSFFHCFAQQPNIDIDENTQNRIMTFIVQNCDLTAHRNATPVIIENDRQIPAFGLYENQWDTLYIRSEKIEIPFFDSQIKIILVQDGNTPFAFPISCTVSTGYIKNKGKQHAGVDFAVFKKEPVVACFDGVVRLAKKFETYGNTVIIRHYNGLETLYAQLDNVGVVAGQKVSAGELIGYIGSENQGNRNALHFETRFLNEFFNPEKVIHFSERKLQGNMLALTPNDFISIPITNANPFEQQEETKIDENSSQKQLLETPKSMPVYHTVEKGETIYRICSKYNITEQQLRALNHIKNDHIEIGQKLRIK